MNFNRIIVNQIIDLSHITKLADDAVIDNQKEGNIIKASF